MNTLQRERAEAIFLELVAQPADSWPALLDSRCEGDAELRGEVASLLGCHQEAGSFLDRQELLALTPDLVKPSEPPLGEGTKVGEYTIERVIGAGGMGVVYQARQERPRRTVALKLVNSAIASRALLRRFEHEAEMLGRLQHPGIAQIFEAGAADAGEGSPRRPYIAMELVEGPSLLEYARTRNLSTRDRLELMIRVCDAIQHAHQRGVIHRDLKPANILVDPTGQPKVLDFGVARAVAADLQVTTQHTSVGQLIGTLPYMSPEQVLGQPNEIDTRSDVYALGVILFESLTGRQPLDLSGRSVPEAVSIIRNHDPMRLSAASRVHRGELDVIVAKALEKDKNRRYQSAAELAADLSHYLAGEPITARADSALYVIRKQLRRHRGPVIVGVAAVLGLLVFAVYASVQSHRNSVLAEKERQARLEADTARDLSRANAEQLRQNLYVSAIGFAQAAQASNDMGRLKRVLDSCPEDLRGWEWKYLRASSDTAARVRALHDGRTNIVPSPDGSICLQFLHEAPVLVIDPLTGRELQEIDLGGGQLTAGSISPDNRIAVLGDAIGMLYVVELRTGAFRKVRGPYDFPIHPYAVFEGNDRVLAICQTSPTELQAHAIDLTTGAALWAVDYTSHHFSCSISPDGKKVAVGDIEGNVRILNADGCPLREPLTSRGWVRSVRFSPDSSRLAIAGNEGAVYIVDLERDRVARHQLFSNKIWTVAWSPDGKHIAAAGTEGYIRVIESVTGVATASHFGHDTTINVLSWRPDGLLSSAMDRTMRWWVDPQRPPRPTIDLGEEIQCACWAADGQSFFLGCDSGKVVEVDARSMSVRRPIMTMPKLVSFINRSRDGALLAIGSETGEVVVLDAKTMDRVSTMRSPTGRALGLAFSADGSQAALMGDSYFVTIWDPRTGSLLAEFPRQSSTAIRGDYSPDGRFLAVAYNDYKVRLHDARSGEVVRVLEGPQSWLIQPQFTPDGKSVACACDDAKVYIWDLETHDPPRTLVGHQSAVFGGTLSPDGTRYASGGWDNTVRLWDVRAGVELLTWRPHIGANWGIAFSPDGSRFVSASKDGTACLWTFEPRR